MTHPWIPNDQQDIIEKMNKTIGIRGWEELFKPIPKEIILRDKLRIGENKPLSVHEIEKRFKKQIKDNPSFLLSNIFSGEPFCPHYTHPLVEYIASRGEFLTAYTPYQPEINQGILQALYEYQSLMAILYDVDVVNSGMYDGATALAEASLMAIRIKRRRKIMAPESLFPSYKSVLKTYLMGPEAKLIFYKDDTETGEPQETLYDILRIEKPDAVIIDYPSCRGAVREKIEDIIEEAHLTDSLAIVLSDPTALGILKPPGTMDADIVVGEGQNLGLPLYHGGSALGILGIRDDRSLLRNLPGRLIGKTIDVDGKEGYMMILQTREQHIRREKATSNITTNTTLNAIMAAINVALLGEKGFKSLSRRIFENTLYLERRLASAGVVVYAPKSLHFKRLTYSISSPENVLEKIIRERKIIPFSLLGDNYVQTCVTEVHEREDIDKLFKALKEEVEINV